MSHSNRADQSTRVKSIENNEAPGAELTRRSALGCIALGSTAGAMAMSGVADAAIKVSAPWAGAAMLDLNYKQWQDQIGQQFMVSDELGGNRCSMQLLEVYDERRPRKQDPHRPANVRRNPVSLLFAADRKVDDATLKVTHPRLGKSSLFFHSTVRTDQPNRNVYAVVIN